MKKSAFIAASILALAFAVFLNSRLRFTDAEAIRDMLSRDGVVPEIPVEEKAVYIFPFSEGERFFYHVTMAGLKVGTAELIYEGQTVMGDTQAAIIKLNTRVPNLKDTRRYLSIFPIYCRFALSGR